MKQILYLAICLFFALNIEASTISISKDDSESFFAIDKSKHNSKTERDTYENTLIEELTSMLYEMSNYTLIPESDVVNSTKTAENLLGILNTMRYYSDESTIFSIEPIQSQIKGQYPDIDLETCYANNGELYSLIELAQLANCSIDMFELLNKTIRLYYSLYQECLLNQDCDKDGSTSAKLKQQTAYKVQRSSVIAEKTIYYTEVLQDKIEMINMALTQNSK